MVRNQRLINVYNYIDMYDLCVVDELHILGGNVHSLLRACISCVKNQDLNILNCLCCFLFLRPEFCAWAAAPTRTQTLPCQSRYHPCASWCWREMIPRWMKANKKKTITHTFNFQKCTSHKTPVLHNWHWLLWLDSAPPGLDYSRTEVWKQSVLLLCLIFNCSETDSLFTLLV